MKVLRSMLALAVIGGLMLAAASSDVFAQKGKKGTFGKVTKIEKKGDDVVSITLSYKAKKDDTDLMTKVFKITKDTKVQKAPAEKGGEPTTAKIGDLEEGKSVVRVEASADDAGTAATITILAGKKKAA